MQKAFTLIELLVVVLIIGILSAVALPQYQLAVQKSRLMSVLPVMRAINTAQEEYMLANGVYASSFDDLSIQLPANSPAHCYFPTAYSLDCLLDSHLVIEKYYNRKQYLCWPQDDMGEKLCKAISGSSSRGSACSSGSVCVYDVYF